MNAKDAMIEYQGQESPWLTLAKRIVREDRARKAQQKESHEGLQRIEIPETPGA